MFQNTMVSMVYHGIYHGLPVSKHRGMLPWNTTVYFHKGRTYIQYDWRASQKRRSPETFDVEAAAAVAVTAIEAADLSLSAEHRPRQTYNQVNGASQTDCNCSLPRRRWLCLLAQYFWDSSNQGWYAHARTSRLNILRIRLHGNWIVRVIVWTGNALLRWPYISYTTHCSVHTMNAVLQFIKHKQQLKQPQINNVSDDTKHERVRNELIFLISDIYLVTPNQLL